MPHTSLVINQRPPIFIMSSTSFSFTQENYYRLRDPENTYCPHCNEKYKMCSYANTMERVWARKTCQAMHE